MMQALCDFNRPRSLERLWFMTALFYTFIGVFSLGLFVICAYFLLRKERKADSTVDPIN